MCVINNFKIWYIFKNVNSLIIIKIKIKTLKNIVSSLKTIIEKSNIYIYIYREREREIVVLQLGCESLSLSFLFI